jgi:hypothetical protein
MPILFNEDDHFDFQKPENNFTSAIAAHASWAYFDYRMKGETFNDGYKSPPVNWKISSPRKKGPSTCARRLRVPNNRQTGRGIGCPTWIRTMTKASKGPCATITPSDNSAAKIPSPPAGANSFFRERFPQPLFLRRPDSFSFSILLRMPPSLRASQIVR